jgi:hypothetical protein
MQIFILAFINVGEIIQQWHVQDSAIWIGDSSKVRALMLYQLLLIYNKT